ncbi:unnamed protein product [Ectocarpus sp. 12 AP-2014]
MASRGGSVVVWLLATFTILTVFMPQELQVAACSEEIATCEADAVCNECMLVGDTFNQEFEDCNAEGNSFCLANLQHSCCQNQVLETDCLANEAFVAYWWSCWMHTCDISYPNAEDCSEFLGVPVTSGDVTDTGGTPAPTVTADELRTFNEATRPTSSVCFLRNPCTFFPGTLTTASTTTDSTVPATAPPTAADTAVPDPIAAETPVPVAAPVPAPTATPEAAAPTASTAIEVGEVTTVTVTTNAFDTRTDDDGCAPDGCTAENTRDGDLTDNSRWSCSAGLVEAAGGAAGEECQIVFELGEAQLVTSVSVAFFKGDTRTRTLNINVNGELLEVVTSSGTTSGLETFELDAGAGAPGVLSLGMESSGLTADEFLSIMEVEIAVGDSSVSSSAAASETPAPVALPTPASVASETPAPAVLSTPAPAALPTPAPAALPTPGPVVAPTESAVPAPTPTPLVVAVDTPAPSTSAVTPPASASDPTPAPTSSARDVDITPSPTTELGTVGSGPSSEDTTTVTSGIDALYSSTGDCTSCIFDDECSECLSADGFTDENAAELYSECMQEMFTTTVDFTDVDQCEYMLAMYCCLSSASENDCMAMDEYVELIQCTLADCSFDDITCSGVIGAEAAGSGADPAVPLAISYLRAVSTITLGLVVVLVAMV